MRNQKYIFVLLLILTACKPNNEEANKMLFDYQEVTTFINDLADSLQAETIAVSFYDLETQQSFQINEKQMLHAASTMKVPVMIELFRQAEAGKFSLEDSITIKNEFKSIVDSSLYSISDDSEKTLYARLEEKISIRELIVPMITQSSNLATNLLIELVGAKNVTQTMRHLGAKDSQVLRGVEDIKAFRKGWSNRTTSQDMMIVLRAIAENSAASETACREMIDILKAQHFTEGIASGLPEGVFAATKSGAIQGIEHDCGIIFVPNRKPYILVVLTKGIADQKSAQQAIAAISQKTYHALVGNYVSR